MIEVEVLGARRGAFAAGAPSPGELRRLCILAAASAGIEDAHLALEFVDPERIAELNAEHRSEPGPTDVLSFPIDGAPTSPGAAIGDPAPAREHLPKGELVRDRQLEAIDGAPRELGDVVICPEHTADLREAVIHGVLHLLGMDHETDQGEMLALQRELLARADG
jgi:probable rRNA maturation factor